MGFLLGALKIIIVLGTLVTIHELGHFFVAKACHVKVHKFAIGFGPKLLAKQGKETEYTLRMIPFGGFVQMEGEEEASQDARAFNQRPIYQRILIVAAGATVNILFALMVYFFIATSSNIYYGTKIESLPESSAEYRDGLRAGDTIQKVNGKNVLVGYDVENIIDDSPLDEFMIEVEREGEKKLLYVNLPMKKQGVLGIRYDTEKRIAGILENYPVASSGLQSGDLILAINGEVIDNWQKIGEIITSLPDTSITLTIEREGQEMQLSSRTSSTVGRFYQMNFSTVIPTGLGVIRYAWNETGDYFNATIKGMISAFKGKTENVQVMGPVGIAEEISSTSSILEFFYLMSAISLSLGIFNLFPIPALDGGKIVILLIEKIRRKPMEQETEAKLTLIGFSLILLVAIVVTFSDVAGLIR